jgi:hypothetical protein
MNTDGLLQSFVFPGIQSTNHFDQAGLVQGTDLVGFLLGILGQIPFSLVRHTNDVKFQDQIVELGTFLNSLTYESERLASEPTFFQKVP